jgi:glycerol-3-phosphate dehydrogenase
MTPTLSDFASQPWDLLVIGGGITGAGIMREAARLGKRVLLVEQNDFASGTSSRSSKLIHGGLHYLARGQLGLVREAVRERERLIRAGTGLVERQGFVLVGEDDRRHKLLNYAGLGLYDLLARRRPGARHLDVSDIQRHAPGLAPHCTEALAYVEAVTDDARLVLCVIRQGCRLGGQALNYVEAIGLLRGANGRVIGARLRNRETGEEAELGAQVVVNAAGPWADTVRAHLGAPARLRLVRGSHLIFPGHRLPVTQAIAARHPDSRHPICVVPWEGVTMIGTTSIEDRGSMNELKRISHGEVAYLLRAAQVMFPALGLSTADIRATLTGVRPIVDARTSDAATASRDYAIWDEDGLVTVAGGKLTTFHLMAVKTLRKLCHRWPDRRCGDRPSPVFEECGQLPPGLPYDTAIAHRLGARYGSEGLAAISAMSPDDHHRMPSLGVLWGELRWAARAECVRHLDDLLLRRLRIGLTVADGGLALFEGIRPIVKSELGWCEERWQSEVAAYRQRWQREHGVPEFETPFAST